jgi:hypothetical protein
MSIDPEIADAGRELVLLMNKRFPNDVAKACAALMHALCPLVVSNSVSIADARHTIESSLNLWFQAFGPEAAVHFKDVQPKVN